jgi:hypothetical protein
MTPSHLFYFYACLHAAVLNVALIFAVYLLASAAKLTRA